MGQGRREDHWLIDTLIAKPMSGYLGRRRHRFATGLGSRPAACLIGRHFWRFLVDSDARELLRIIVSQTAPLCEYVAASADGRSIRPAFGDLFVGEALPDQGRCESPMRRASA